MFRQILKYTLLALIYPALKDKKDFLILVQMAGYKRPVKVGPVKLNAG